MKLLKKKQKTNPTEKLINKDYNLIAIIIIVIPFII